MKDSGRKITEKVLSRLRAERPVHMKLPGNGVLSIDHPVPFLLVYRIPPDGEDRFTLELGKTESSYIMVSGKEEELLKELTGGIIGEFSDRFGAFLLLEAWVTDREDADDFTIHVSHEGAAAIAEKLREELDGIRVGRTAFTASVTESTAVSPPYYRPILQPREAKQSESLVIGLEIRPVYINPETGRSYPLFLRELRKAFGKALKKTFFEFVRLHTSHTAAHFEMLGKTVIEEIVWEIDTRLAEYNNLFNFLFLVTPVNIGEAWESFTASGFRKNPVFHYRPMPIDPELIKRRLYDLPIERISDPTIAFLFRDKRKEIDRMLNMMAEREKDDFMHSSLQLFGRIGEDLVDIARALLVALPPAETHPKKETLPAGRFAAMARSELNYLRKQHPEVENEVYIRDDIDGVLVSRGVLWISKDFRVSKVRAKGLIQHEIGTHVSTYYNGKAQPFRLFYTGVPGYEQLQEGLAVLAEYVMDGLTSNRLRTLAGRVMAVHRMISGHSFPETFELLHEKYKFTPESAFSMTMRVYRGGGLTKDAVYLKGFLNLLEYLKKGNELQPLLIGKIREDYLPIVEELLHRRLLKPVPILPRFLEDNYRERIEELRKGVTLFNIIKQ